MDVQVAASLLSRKILTSPPLRYLTLFFWTSNARAHTVLAALCLQENHLPAVKFQITHSVEQMQLGNRGFRTRLCLSLIPLARRRWWRGVLVVGWTISGDLSNSLIPFLSFRCGECSAEDLWYIQRSRRGCIDTSYADQRTSLCDALWSCGESGWSDQGLAVNGWYHGLYLGHEDFF